MSWPMGTRCRSANTSSSIWRSDHGNLVNTLRPKPHQHRIERRRALQPQGAHHRRGGQDPRAGVRGRLDFEDPLPRRPEAALAAPYARWLPALQPGGRRAPADDPAHAARRVPAASGDSPGTRGRRPRGAHRRGPSPRGHRRGRKGLAAVARGAGGRNRRRSGPDQGARGLAARPARQRAGGEVLRRHRPRDRPGQRRARSLRGWRPQPECAAPRSRSRGPAARGRGRSGAPVPEPQHPPGGDREPGEPRRGLQQPHPHAARPRSAEADRRGVGLPLLARVVRRRRIAAPASALWAVITDPYHMPRWWPNTQRVENVSEGSPAERSWPQVLETRDGRGVRADYHGVDATDGERYVFEQTVEGTPFERFVKRARTEIKLSPQDGETDVTMSLDRRLRGLSRLGSPMMRRAIGRTLNEALSGLETAATGGSS